VRANLQRRIEQLEARCRAAQQRVRIVWWRGREPYPEAAEGERLIVVSWQDEDDDAPSSPAPGATLR
jgi:hypothetical protein